MHFSIQLLMRINKVEIHKSDSQVPMAQVKKD